MIMGTLPEETLLYVYKNLKNEVDIFELFELLIVTFKFNAYNVIYYFDPEVLGDQRDMYSTIISEWLFSCSIRNFLEKALSYNKSPLNFYYLYLFEFSFDFQGWDNFTLCNNHTCHGSDMPYTFDNPDDKFTDTGRYVAHQHMSYWANFAKYGTPNDNFLVHWPTYNATNRTFLSFFNQTTIKNDYSTFTIKDCDFLDSIGYYY